MNKKIFLQVFMLAILLVMVLMAMGYTKSSNFKSLVKLVFGVNESKAYTWCPDHAIDFVWKDPRAKEKFKALDNWTLEKQFCSLEMEPLQGVDLAQIQFKPLLRVQSAEAKVGLLEFSREAKVFQVNGLPFSSTYLRREILDEP